MNITNTGIAVAVAVVVIAFVFIFPQYSPFSVLSSPPPVAVATSTDTANVPAGTSTTAPLPTQPSSSMTTPDGLQITDDVVGTGATLAPGDTVAIKYVGSLTDGTVFDSSDAHGGTPLMLVVSADGTLHLQNGSGLIPGWSEGVVGMKAGGTRTLVIPPALGYGSQAVGNIIPANSTLVFQLQLLTVTGPK